MMAAESVCSEGKRGVNGHGGHLLGKLPKPVFSGHVEDWREFAQEWVEWRDLQKEGSPDLSDRAMLELLKGSLDPASKSLLRTMRIEDPQVSFSTFWRKLDQELGGDLGHLLPSAVGASFPQGGGQIVSV